MSNDGEKVSIKFCPFQTQIGGGVKVGSHEQMLLGSAAIPLIKVACDKEKCQLWDRDTLTCSVYVAAVCLSAISDSLDNVAAAIREQ